MICPVAVLPDKNGKTFICDLCRNHSENYIRSGFIHRSGKREARSFVLQSLIRFGTSVSRSAGLTLLILRVPNSEWLMAVRLAAS
jgi:hypothetical protein